LDNKAPDFDRRSRPSSLHTVGFCLSTPNEALRLERGISRNAAQEASLVRSIETDGVQSAFAAATNQTLFYEDLLYGYMPDVQVEEESAWHSLAARRQSFWFDRDRRTRGDKPPDFAAPNDEGCIGAGADRQVDEDGTVHLRISENLIRWDG
jgi:hypothetical protein